MARTKMAVPVRRHAVSQKSKPVSNTKGKVVLKVKSVQTDGKVKKPHRFRPGTVSLREIRRYQKSVELLLPKARFMRLVREIAEDCAQEIRFTKESAFAIQEAAEDYIVDVYQDAYAITMARKRVGICPIDVQIALKIRGENVNEVNAMVKSIAAKRVNVNARKEHKAKVKRMPVVVEAVEEEAVPEPEHLDMQIFERFPEADAPPQANMLVE